MNPVIFGVLIFTPLDWLQQAGYCDWSEDCQGRVENNQLYREHYSDEIIFQRLW